MMEERKWLNFYYAVQEVRERLKVSDGEARRLLRECRSVKTQRQPYDPRTGLDLEPPERLTSKHWRDDDMDLARDEDGTPYFVDVDEADFRFWLDNQARSSAPAERRSSQKRDQARQAVQALWPDGVPKVLHNKKIEKEIGDLLKAKGQPEISRDTILRAAGRK
jgi:hypothetical protein